MQTEVMPPPSGGRADAERAAEAAAGKCWVKAPALARELGVTTRTLLRWLRDVPMGFPRPTKINGRNYSQRSEIEAWKSAAARRAMGAR
jgi:predicted DNA-binding transcriptional regulator AlpA